MLLELIAALAFDDLSLTATLETCPRVAYSQMKANGEEFPGGYAIEITYSTSPFNSVSETWISDDVTHLSAPLNPLVPVGWTVQTGHEFWGMSRSPLWVHDHLAEQCPSYVGQATYIGVSCIDNEAVLVPCANSNRAAASERSIGPAPVRSREERLAEIASLELSQARSSTLRTARFDHAVSNLGCTKISSATYQPREELGSYRAMYDCSGGVFLDAFISRSSKPIKRSAESVTFSRNAGGKQVDFFRRTDHITTETSAAFFQGKVAASITAIGDAERSSQILLTLADQVDLSL